MLSTTLTSMFHSKSSMEPEASISMHTSARQVCSVMAEYTVPVQEPPVVAWQSKLPASQGSEALGRLQEAAGVP